MPPWRKLLAQRLLVWAAALSLASSAACLAGAPESRLEWIEVAKDGKGFVGAPSGKKFTPWGFNYDHDRTGRLIEDYWDGEWPTVVQDFREMKELGANVVRIHLQVSKFMDAPDRPNSKSLEQLGRLLALAEETGLYLDLTGLGCYHKKDVPPWYEALGEKERWDVQARFWEAVTERCAASPAVFCYDLMNEPVVPGRGDKRGDWLGAPFAGNCFVQFITLETGARQRPAVAQAWIHRLKAAIRQRDPRHLVTVGLVPWSLDRPGLTSGFVPREVAPELDFVCVHLYPARGKLEEDLKTLEGFAVGKPVVIEETFPLSCGADDLMKFIDKSRACACGWIGFYWGQTPAELKASGGIGEAMTLAWLEVFQKARPQD